MDIGAHFDQDSLVALKEIMEDEFDDLIELFLRDSDQRLPRIHAAAVQQDSDTLRAQIHSLKGASGNICAYRLSEMALEVEDRVRQTDRSSLDWDHIKLRLRDIDEEYRYVKDFIHRGFA
jgi:HPt (histidine-containing phosphotransfer) domain-containing protein